MTLEEILPVEKWMAIEMEINREFNINAAVYNPEGLRITRFVKWANELCPLIKNDKQGQTFICAAAHQDMAARAKKSKNPVINECDAGLIKIVVPIFSNGDFAGVFSCCGQRIDSQELESFHISSITGIKEDEIDRLSKDIQKIASIQADKIVQHIETRIQHTIERSHLLPLRTKKRGAFEHKSK